MIDILLGSIEFCKMECITLKEVNTYKKSWRHYLKEIVEVIEDLESRGIFSYISTVAENCKHLNLEKEILEHFVYTSKQYVRNKRDFDIVEKYKETYKDWIEPTEERLREFSKNKIYVTVVGLGKEPFKARPFFDSENNLFWLKPRYTRRGYTLNLTKYKF